MSMCQYHVAKVASFAMLFSQMCYYKKLLYLIYTCMRIKHARSLVNYKFPVCQWGSFFNGSRPNVPGVEIYLKKIAETYFIPHKFMCLYNQTKSISLIYCSTECISSVYAYHNMLTVDYTWHFIDSE